LKGDQQEGVINYVMLHKSLSSRCMEKSLIQGSGTRRD